MLNESNKVKEFTSGCHLAPKKMKLLSKRLATKVNIRMV